MYKLKFLLADYARPLYRWLAAGAAIGAIVAGSAAFTAYFAPVVIVVGTLAGLVVTAAATLGILALNVLVAAGLQRGIDRFEAAYDTYRRANNIPDIFYEEMDLAEAAQRR
jgi:hypothetical protein